MYSRDRYRCPSCGGVIPEWDGVHVCPRPLPLAPAPAEFVIQSDRGVCSSERHAVLQACLLDDRPFLRRALPTLGEASQAAGSLCPLRSTCPVGTVEFCRAWMRAVGVREPEPIDYPECLRPALGRFIAQVPFTQARVGSWIKPVRTKAWAPHVLAAGEAHPSEEAVWECAPIPREPWVAEWRVYVLRGQVIGSGRYDDRPRETVHYDETTVQSWVDTYSASGQAPAGYALDVALLADGRTILVKVTDGWAIGLYRGTCSTWDYTELLAARWAEISS